MSVGENLFQNLLVVFIFVILGVIIYCRVTHQTLLDLIREIREAFSDQEVIGG